MAGIALVPGSFDPVTAGHVDIIRRAAALFDRVYAVVMENAEKKCLFTPEIRLKLLRDAVGGIENVYAEYYSGYTYEYVRQKNVCAIVKGVRSAEDFEYEAVVAGFNRKHCPEAETLLLYATDELGGVSSSLVREMARRGESLRGLVTPMCEKALRDVFTRI